MGHHNQLLTCTVTVDAGCFGMYSAHVGRTALLQSLGYEPTDVRLRRLGQSLVTALTSADLRREVVPGLLHLCRLSLSRRVRFTNRFTEPVLEVTPEAPWTGSG